MYGNALFIMIDAGFRTTWACSRKIAEGGWTINETIVRTPNHSRLAFLDCTDVPTPDWSDEFIHDGVAQWLIVGRFKLAIVCKKYNWCGTLTQAMKNI